MAVQIRVSAEHAPARLAHVIPSRVLRHQRSTQQVLRRHETDALEMKLGGFWGYAIELYPRAATRELLVDCMIPFILGMDPDEFCGSYPFGRDYCQLLQSGCAVARMRCNRQSGFARS